MKITCPEHNGLISVNGLGKKNQKNVFMRNVVVSCPVCQEEVIINGKFDFDQHGIAHPVKQELATA